MHRLVITLALERLKDDNSSVDVMTLGPVKDITTRFYQKPEEYAMSRYAYYQCPSCSDVSTAMKCLKYVGEYVPANLGTRQSADAQIAKAI